MEKSTAGNRIHDPAVTRSSTAFATCTNYFQPEKMSAQLLSSLLDILLKVFFMPDK